MSYVFQCEACHVSMSMSDLMFARRVAGKQVTLKCKACKADIRIDGVALATKRHVEEVRSFAPSKSTQAVKANPPVVIRPAAPAASKGAAVAVPRPASSTIPSQQKSTEPKPPSSAAQRRPAKAEAPQPSEPQAASPRPKRPAKPKGGPPIVPRPTTTISSSSTPKDSVAAAQPPAAAATLVERPVSVGRRPPPAGNLRRTLLGVTPDPSPPRPPPPQRAQAAAPNPEVNPFGATTLDAPPTPPTPKASDVTPPGAPAAESPSTPTTPEPAKASNATPPGTPAVESPSSREAPRNEAVPKVQASTPQVPNEAAAPLADLASYDIEERGAESQRDTVVSVSPMLSRPPRPPAPMLDASAGVAELEAAIPNEVDDPGTPPISWAPGPRMIVPKRRVLPKTWAAVGLGAIAIGALVLLAARLLQSEAPSAPATSPVPVAAAKPRQPQPNAQAPSRPAAKKRSSPLAAAAPQAAPQPAASAAPSTKSANTKTEASEAARIPSSGIPEGVKENVLVYRVYLAVKRAEQCHRGGRATGTAKIILEFEPNGHVKNARLVGEPIASAPVGTCVLHRVSSVTLPPYEGAPFTYEAKVTLR